MLVPSFIHGVNPAMAGDHNDMTRAAVEVLPAWQREMLGSQEEPLVSDYCGYPDQAAYSEWAPSSPAQEEALRWQYMEKGRQYHYWMLESWERGAHHRMRHEVPIEENHGFFIRGAEFFFSSIEKSILKNDLAGAAKYAGSFMHANQDPATPIHCLEDSHGLGWQALESLFHQGSQFDPANSAVRLLAQVPRMGGLNVEGYQPRLLGTSPAEAAFQLYRRHVEVLRYSRGQLLKVIDLARQNQWDQASRLLQISEEGGAQISADILFTALSMAGRRFDARQVQTLETVDLSRFPPIDAPSLLSRPYGFSPIACGYALSPDGQKAPLRLKIAVTNGYEVQEIASGLATGGHVLGYRLAWLLPAGVYQTFTCQAGLHPDFTNPGTRVSLRMKFRGKTKWSKRFTKDDGAEQVSVAVQRGGLLELVLDDALEGGLDSTSAQIVWGNLELRKNRSPALGE